VQQRADVDEKRRAVTQGDRVGLHRILGNGFGFQDILERSGALLHAQRVFAGIDGEHEVLAIVL
jgi:hypothetical protein